MWLCNVCYIIIFFVAFELSNINNIFRKYLKIIWWKIGKKFRIVDEKAVLSFEFMWKRRQEVVIGKELKALSESKCSNYSRKSWEGTDLRMLSNKGGNSVGTQKMGSILVNAGGIHIGPCIPPTCERMRILPRWSNWYMCTSRFAEKFSCYAFRSKNPTVFIV